MIRSSIDKSLEETRPPADRIASREEFERWYWPVDALREFCTRLNVPSSGNKKELRERVALALDGGRRKAKRSRIQTSGQWSNMSLSMKTTITADISFGPNLRSFFKTKIGKKFVCHSDFMDWVRSNTGSTLGDAVQAWQVLEEKKRDPAFRREIAESNNFLQYLRDIRDANPGLTLEQAKECWDAKKIRPAIRGRVVYESMDLRFLHAR